MLDTTYFVSPVEGQPEFMHVWRVLRGDQDEVSRRYMGQGQGRTPEEAIADCFRLELGSIEEDAARLKDGTLRIEVDQVADPDHAWMTPPAPLRLELARIAGQVDGIADYAETLLQHSPAPLDVKGMALGHLRDAFDLFREASEYKTDVLVTPKK